MGSRGAVVIPAAVGDKDDGTIVRGKTAKTGLGRDIKSSRIVGDFDGLSPVDIVEGHVSRERKRLSGFAVRKIIADIDVGFAGHTESDTIAHSPLNHLRGNVILCVKIIVGEGGFQIHGTSLPGTYITVPHADFSLHGIV